MVGSFSTRGRQYTGTGTFFIRVSSWPPLGLSCNHKAEATWARGLGQRAGWAGRAGPSGGGAVGAPWGCPGGSPAAVLPAPAPPPAPAPHAPCSTCLYLAGRLQPQACSRPSSLRTCSRTWRYCSRFCSRRAEDVQSLGRRHAGYFPRRPPGLPCMQHARASGPRWQDRGSPRTDSTGTCPCPAPAEHGGQCPTVQPPLPQACLLTQDTEFPASALEPKSWYQN